LEERLHAWLKNACKLARNSGASTCHAPSELELESIEAWRTPDALSQVPETAVGFALQSCESLTSLIVLPRPLALALVGGAMEKRVRGADRELTAWKILWASISLIICWSL